MVPIAPFSKVRMARAMSSTSIVWAEVAALA